MWEKLRWMSWMQQLTTCTHNQAFHRSFEPIKLIDSELWGWGPSVRPPVNICLSLYIYIYIYNYIKIHISLSLSLYIYIYICVYRYTHTFAAGEDRVVGQPQAGEAVLRRVGSQSIPPFNNLRFNQTQNNQTQNNQTYVTIKPRTINPRGLTVNPFSKPTFQSFHLKHR